MTTYSNPRMRAVIENWPMGRDKRATATFEIERSNRGERAVRTTTGKPKALTYALMSRIVDGDDGRTYILRFVGSHISVMRGDMQFSHESIFPDDPRYADLMILLQRPTRAVQS